MKMQNGKINVETVVSELGLKIAAGDQGLGRMVEDGYCGDLLSDVMGNAPSGSIWITIQSHQNIVAVALLREIAAIAITGGFAPDPDTVARANQEGIPILTWPGSSYNLAGKLYEMGIAVDGNTAERG